MMGKLTPPTDNLYKFIAITGLIGVVLGVVLGVRQVNVNLQAQIAAHVAIQEAWLAVGDSEDAKILLIEAMAKAKEGESPFGLSIQAEEIEGLSPEALSKIRLFEIQSDALSREIQLQDWVASALGYGIGTSLLIMGIGFWHWYFKTQRLQDIILRKKAEDEAPSEIQTGPANAYRKWTDEDNELLKAGFEAKQSLKDLAKSLGRSRGAIRSRLVKLGLVEDCNT